MTGILICETVKNAASAKPNLVMDADGTTAAGNTLILNGSTSGTFTLTGPSGSGVSVTTLPARSGNVGIDGPAFNAYQNTNIPLTANTETVVLFNTVASDTSSSYSTGTGRFTPNVAGYYQINTSVAFSYGSGTSVNSVPFATIKKNSTEYLALSQQMVPPGAAGTRTASCSASAVVYLNGTTDYVSVSVNCAGESNVSVLSLAFATSFNGTFVRGA